MSLFRKILLLRIVHMLDACVEIVSYYIFDAMTSWSHLIETSMGLWTKQKDCHFLGKGIICMMLDILSIRLTSELAETFPVCYDVCVKVESF